MNHFIGIPDEHFIRGNIPMTKQEVRILAVTKARVAQADTIIDIGAGTGSLSIEAALLAKSGQVFAIEKEPEGIELIKANAEKFNVNNIKIIQGTAPDALVDLPLCEVIFIGGSGGRLTEIVKCSDKILKPGGRLIITAVTVETLYNALQLVQANPYYTVEAFGVQVTRIRTIASNNMLLALNPIYIIACTKGGQ